MEVLGHEAYGMTDVFLGIAAITTSLALHLYPLPIFRRIVKQKSTGDLLYYPYFATQIACMLWVCYSVPAKGSELPFNMYCLLTVNKYGLVFQIGYFIYFQNNTTKEQRKDMLFMAKQEFVWAALAPLILPSWYNAITGPERIRYLGPAAVIFGILMYVSHLPTIIDAIQTKNSNKLPFGMCTIYFANAVVWFIYGYAYTPTYDVYVAFANGIGSILGVVQLLLCLLFFINFRNLSGVSKDLPTNGSESTLLASDA